MVEKNVGVGDLDVESDCVMFCDREDILEGYFRRRGMSCGSLVVRIIRCISARAAVFLAHRWCLH